MCLQDTVLQLLKEAMIDNIATSKGFLIDGYPRELEQGTRFEAEVRRTHYTPVDILHITHQLIHYIEP